MKNYANQLDITSLIIICLSLFSVGCSSKSRLINDMEREVALYSNDASAYYELGERCYFSTDDKMRSKAVEAFVNSALLGNKDAQCVLGYLYYNGDYVSRDLNESKDWLNIAEKNGSMLASKLKHIYFEK